MYISFLPISLFLPRIRISQERITCGEARGYFFTDSGLWWGEREVDIGTMTAIECILPRLDFTSKTQNHCAKNSTRVEYGNVCHIPQPDFISNVFLACCHSCTSYSSSGVHYLTLPSHSFLSINCTFRWMKGCFLVFVIDKGFCHVAVPSVFSTGQFSLDYYHCLRSSTQLRKPRREFHNVGFSYWWFPSPVLEGIISFFSQEKRPYFIHCNTNYLLIKWSCWVIIVLYCWENLSKFMLMIPIKGKASM